MGKDNPAWIDINKKKPRDGQNVIAVGTWHGEVTGRGESDSMGLGTWSDEYNCVDIASDKYCTEIREVSYWMPLPSWPEV